MKKKTFYTTILLFLLFFYAMIFFLTLILWREKLEATKEMVLSEHYMVMSAMIQDMRAVENRDGNLSDSMVELLKPYVNSRRDGKRSFLLYGNEILLYSNSPEAEPEKEGHEQPESKETAGAAIAEAEVPEKREEAERQGTQAEQGRQAEQAEPEEGAEEENFYQVTGRRKVSIVSKQTEDKERQFLSVEGYFPEPWQEYSLVCRLDIQKMYDDWRQLKHTLFLIGGSLSFLLSICLLVLLNRLFKPLQQIASTSAEMAEGNFRGRLPIRGKDEISAMARSYNHMAVTIEEQMEALREAATQKQQLVDNFAHELRTPLTAIYGYAEYLQKAVLTEDDRLAATAYIMSESRRLSKLSHQLLDLAILRGEEIQRERIPVSRLFEAVRCTLERKAAERGITLLFQTETEELFGNQDLLESLLINLIDNGIKACNHGGTVRIRAYEKDKKAVLSIADNGRGMPPEEVSHVTEAFYRIDKARSRLEGGAGLGLAFCEQIVLLHQARLQIQSKQGKGTTVFVYFSE